MAQAVLGKADFDEIYDRADPRDYFRTLGGLDYEIPQRAEPVFTALLGALKASRAPGSPPLSVLDLCCSYGVNAALLRCDVTFDELFARYSDPSCDALTPDEMAELDRAYFDGRCRPDAVRVAGLDAASNAIAYAQRVGLLDRGWAEDLQVSEPSADLADHLAGVDLITTTGGVGYITEPTFERVVRPRAGGQAPWVAAFVLRCYDYSGIAQTLTEHGLVTERLEGVSFPQRRFASEAERAATLQGLAERGLDPTGLEAEGRYYADLHLSRPASDAAGLPIEQLLAGALP